MQQAIVRSAVIIRAMQKDGARAGVSCFSKIESPPAKTARASPRWLSGDQES
jgi:hypothetical protein